MMYDSIIVGAGPAGISAAIQLKGAGFQIALFEKRQVGGLVLNANCIKNYLGFFGEISGKELTTLFKNHLITVGIIPIIASVISIKKEKNIFVVTTSAGTYTAKTVIIATGTTPKTAQISGEKELSGKRIFYEIIDFPFDEKEKDVAVIGGGDVGFDYAIQLAEKKQRPYILTKQQTKCAKQLKEKAEHLNIPVFENSNITSIKENNNKNNNNKNNQSNLDISCDDKIHKADFILIAVGRKPSFPNTEYTDTANKKGIFIAGAAQATGQRHIQIASGDGMKAAIDAIEYLKCSHKRRQKHHENTL